MANLLTFGNDFNISDNAIFNAKIHWISYVLPIAFMSIGVFGFLGVFIDFHVVRIISLFLIFLFFKGTINFLKNRMTKIFLTEKHLTIATGILSKITSDISLSKIEGISLYQSFSGRLLGYGELIISTGDITHSYKIEKPMKLRSEIMKQISNLL